MDFSIILLNNEGFKIETPILHNKYVVNRGVDKWLTTLISKENCLF